MCNGSELTVFVYHYENNNSTFLAVKHTLVHSLLPTCSTYARTFLLSLTYNCSIHTGQSTFFASGSLLTVNPDRLLIKRIILTGYPIHVHKRSAIVRCVRLERVRNICCVDETR